MSGSLYSEFLALSLPTESRAEHDAAPGLPANGWGITHSQILQCHIPIGNAYRNIVNVAKECNNWALPIDNRNMDMWLLMEKSKSSARKSTPFSNWLVEAVARRGIDLAELGRIVGSDYNYMWRLSVGLRNRPSHDLTLAIGEALKDVPGAMKAADYKIVSVADNASDPLLRIGQNVPLDVFQHIPFSPGTVTGSMERLGEGDDYSHERLTVAEVLPNDVRAIRIAGDSMEPFYKEGDIVFVHETKEAHDGDVVIALVGLTGITCKVFRNPMDGGVAYLEPYNGEGSIKFPDFIIVGIVVGFYRNTRRK